VVHDQGLTPGDTAGNWNYLPIDIVCLIAKHCDADGIRAMHGVNRYAVQPEGKAEGWQFVFCIFAHVLSRAVFVAVAASGANRHRTLSLAVNNADCVA